MRARIASMAGRSPAPSRPRSARGEDLPALVCHVLARGALAAGADANLHRVRRADQPLLQRFIGPGAVARGFAEVIAPGVAVRVEMHTGQRLAAAVLRLRRAQQRERDRVVAAEEHAVVLRHQRRGLRLDGAAHLGQRRGVRQAHVQRIAQLAQRRHVEHGVDAIAQHQARRADRLRAETRPRPVRHHAVVRHTGHGKRLCAQFGRGQKAVGVVGVGKLSRGHGGPWCGKARNWNLKIPTT